MNAQTLILEMMMVVGALTSVLLLHFTTIKMVKIDVVYLTVLSRILLTPSPKVAQEYVNLDISKT